MIPIIDEYYKLSRPARQIKGGFTQAYEGVGRCTAHLPNGGLFLFAPSSPIIADNGNDYSILLIRESEIIDRYDFGVSGCGFE